MSDIEKISVNGADLAACVDGEAGKPWLVLSNSLACTLESWRLQMATFTATHRVLRYDTRGHGRSSAPAGPYSMATFAADLVGLMDHFGIDKADIVGLSMGGMTGLGVAITYPDRVNRLVCCAARSDSIPPFVDSWNTRIAAIRAAGGMQGVVDFTIERWFTEGFRAANPDAIEEARAMILACDTEGYIACAEALKGLDYKRSLDTIKAPVLYVAGASDGGAPPAAMKEMAALTPGAAYVEIAPAAHIIPMENPEAYNAAVGGWLSGAGLK
ncbi:3-oxoadipate enol-lactonase [Aquabacter spiritensis]|uniref:3-oxoadipate enol-lactonase n=1 Tax=Aquabacter spiritensis TaxID=933073 RepID=A0A4R3M0T0_9HYPH|nr:3-oxoadipate enol-lactonase [Aquabacter spiritensis]TCT06684.1 3-oxoadipate enol-lactonase [Aquabacter spiritensis]